MSVIKSIKNYFKKHIFILFITIILIALVTLISLVPPQILKVLIDDAITPKKVDKLLLLVCLYFTAYLFIFLFDFIKEIVLVIISQGVSKEVKLEMMMHINKMSYSSFTKYDSGNLEAYFSNDVDSIDALITSGAISMVIDLLKIVGIIVSIFLFSVMFGFISLALLPIIIVFTLFVRKRMYNAQLMTRKLEGNVNNIVLENLDNIRTIKSYRIYDKINGKYDDVLNNHFKTSNKSNFYDSFFSPVMQIIKSITICLVLLISSYNESILGLTIGMIASSIDLLTNLFSPIEALGTELQTIQKSMSGIRRINEFFKIPLDEEKLVINDFDLNKIELEFIDVSYAYDGINMVIEHFNLKLEDNEHLTLQGVSGAGKSTIFKLAYGLIKPTSGRVIINGVDSYLIPNKLKSKIFSIVYQDSVFTGGTILDEITLRNSYPIDMVQQALMQVGLERIKDLNKPFVITDYSTGELSLINIARALLFDSKIIFLDEMNAKLDNISANKVIDVINKVSNDKIILSINHYGNLIKNSKTRIIDKTSKMIYHNNISDEMKSINN